MREKQRANYSKLSKSAQFQKYKDKLKRKRLEAEVSGRQPKVKKPKSENPEQSDDSASSEE